MDPEITFVFTQDNQAKVKGLVVMLNLKPNSADISTNSGIFLFELFVAIIREALQFLKIIPYNQETQIEGLKREINSCIEMKEKLKRYVNI